MKSLGATLRSYREKRKYSLADLSRRTRIDQEYLEALENDALDRLPSPAAVQGYIQLIAEEVELDQETALALWRRDAVPASPAAKLTKRRSWRAVLKWLVTPHMLSIGLLIAAATSGALFILWQWNTLSQPPKFEIQEPQQYAQTTSPVVVRGRSAPEATVTINTELISLDQNGNFRTELNLPPGERTLVIQATDSRGRTSERVLFLTVTSP